MDIVALPFWNLLVSFKIPRFLPKIDENSSIGVHIRRRRLELELEQKDVAKFIGTCEDTITGWENDRSEPQIQFAPKVIEFLGYNPYLFETETLGGRIKYYRLLHGLSHKKLGRILRVDATTVGTWEANISKPKPLVLDQLIMMMSEF